MASPLSSWPNPETLPHCFALVRWLHARGIYWSGTVTELAAQLSADSDVTWFTSNEELLSFLEENADMLRELGIDASVQRVAGRPRIVSLQMIAETKREAVVSKATGPIEVLAQPVAETLIEPPPDLSASAEAPLVRPEAVQEVKAETPKPSDSSSDPADRLYALLGIEGKQFVPSVPVPATFAEPPRRSRNTAADVGFSAEGFLERFRPFLIAVVLLLVAAVLMIEFFPRGRVSFTPAAPTVSEAPAQSLPASNLDPQEVKKTKALLQQSTASRLAVPQFELGTRYAEGLGVERDYAAAYAWLTVAKANGSLRADAALRNLGAKISPAEMQRARIIIGKTFADGAIVPRSFVVAHHWFAIAELAGSAEAKSLKKQLEAKMSPDQMHRASATEGSR